MWWNRIHWLRMDFDGSSTVLYRWGFKPVTLHCLVPQVSPTVHGMKPLFFYWCYSWTKSFSLAYIRIPKHKAGYAWICWQPLPFRSYAGSTPRGALLEKVAQPHWVPWLHWRSAAPACGAPLAWGWRIWRPSTWSSWRAKRPWWKLGRKQDPIGGSVKKSLKSLLEWTDLLWFAHLLECKDLVHFGSITELGVIQWTCSCVSFHRLEDSIIIIHYPRKLPISACLNW